MTKLLDIHNLHKSYGKKEVLKGIDFSMEASEKVIVMGPSGSGKSTLLRCINHLEKANDGTMAFGDRTIDMGKWHRDDIKYVRNNTSMVFQNYNLFEHKTALQNVMEGLVHVRKIPRAEAEETALYYLERTGMLEWKDSYPSTLSGGQQQRVGIARALALHPKLVMFDEPTSALDPELVSDVLDIMRQVADTGIAMLVVTHEVSFAKDVADRVVIVDDGVIIEEGEAKRVLEAPQEARTKAFLNILDY